MFKVPEIHRLKTGMFGSDESYGNNGVFIMELLSHGKPPKRVHCLVSDGEGWEHVSTSIVYGRSRSRTPTWDDMCMIKELFWDQEDCVVQFHPPKSQYVNMHPNVLHLWRKQGVKFETPPSILVGLKTKVMKCKICGEEFDPTHLALVALHRHDENIDPSKFIGIKGRKMIKCPHCGSVDTTAWGPDSDKCLDCGLTWSV